MPQTSDSSKFRSKSPNVPKSVFLRKYLKISKIPSKPAILRKSLKNFTHPKISNSLKIPKKSANVPKPANPPNSPMNAYETLKSILSLVNSNFIRRSIPAHKRSRKLGNSVRFPRDQKSELAVRIPNQTTTYRSSFPKRCRMKETAATINLANHEANFGVQHIK